VSNPVAELLRLLQLEPIEEGLYRGAQPEGRRQRMFGGQVLAQALAAAYDTVTPERHLHSLHAYFILPGDTARPILYEVERLRDGRSFTTRRTAAVQHGRPIFYLTASFQVEEPGPEHQDGPPAAALAEDPESFPTLREYLRDSGRQADPGDEEEFAAVEIRLAGLDPKPDPDDRGYPSLSRVWMRTAGPLPDDPKLHTCALAYMSDMTLLPASLVPHDLHYMTTDVMQASLDHAMWFHRPFRADEWLLYDHTSPSASGARGLSMGRIFDRGGRLVATALQEGLTRPIGGPGRPGAHP
jgi:acyl-CoA thioesterase-2